MKKIFTLIAMSAAVLAANAQKPLEGTKFLDNWSVGVVGGAWTKTTHSPIIKNTRAVYGIEVNKQVTPILGFGLQVTATNNATDSRNIIDAGNANILTRVNLSNAIFGYKGEPRFFEVEGIFGLGGMHYFYNGYGNATMMTSQAGVSCNFNLGKDKAWTVSVKPGINWELASSGTIREAFNIDRSAIQILAGVSYHFGNSNGKRYMTHAKLFDQAKIDELNAKVNDLNTKLNGKGDEINKLNGQVRTLQQQLTEARNKKPVEKTEKIIEKGSKVLEQTVTFGQGKTTVDASQLPNVDRIATFLKNHKDSKVVIKGYASPEGKAEVNARIATARAEAVKTILVKKYKIAAERISAEGQGVGNMFSEPDWNRVSICTIETK